MPPRNPYWVIALACHIGGCGVEGAAAVTALPHLPRNRIPNPLDLDDLEDSDCFEDPRSKDLLDLFAQLCSILEQALPNRAIEVQDNAWDKFRAWRQQHSLTFMQLAASIFNRPYCEPGKVATCVVGCLLRADTIQEGDKKQLEWMAGCVHDVDSMLQETAPGKKNPYDTRLHLFLRSPWPVFQVLDLLVRLHPPNNTLAELDLGRCKPHEDWAGGSHEFDWLWFRNSLTSALESATSRHQLFALDPQDGPLSEQYRARWTRIYQTPLFRKAAALGSQTFYKYRRNQWEAGCNPGVVIAYVLQIITFCIRDTEGWLHRYIGSAWRLMNLLTPLNSLVHADWPIFLALHLASLMRRHSIALTPSSWFVAGASGFEPHISLRPVQRFEEILRRAIEPAPEVVYLSAVWGPFAQFTAAFLARWEALTLPLLLLMTMDAESEAKCAEHAQSGVSCITVPQRFAVESMVAKYVALSVITQCGSVAVWLDFDVYLARNPTAQIQQALLGENLPSLVFASFVSSASLSPSIIAANGAEASTMLLRYAAWLYEHPFMLDHQGWDAILRNPDGDFSGGWDYKGRNISMASLADGMWLSFAPAAVINCRYAFLGPEFASGDGWLTNIGTPLTFHFWGAHESQMTLFQSFYPYQQEGFAPEGEAIFSQYRRHPVSDNVYSVAARSQVHGQHLVAITYAKGCCAKAIERNRNSAILVGVDAARAYSSADLDSSWAEQNADVLALRKGAGWWLWKPYLILKTLRDKSIPWNSGVVLWLDAGNFFISDPRPLAFRALLESDVSAIRLKCCLESDWTSMEALQRLEGSHHAIADRPQLGAYFIILRKTAIAISFVEDWLSLAEEPRVLIDDRDGSDSIIFAPSFQRHMADQSIFSVLFKKHGFRALSLEEAHSVVQLDRWRE